MKTTSHKYKETLIKLYKEIFSNINDILTYVRRAFELEKFDHIYIGSQIETISKLDELAEVELHVKSSDFNFNYGYESDKSYVDQIHALMHIYSILPDEEKYNCNFTIFHRPPKFIQRESGKIILLALISIIIAFSYPVTFWTLSFIQELTLKDQQNQYTIINTQKKNREAIINNLNIDKRNAVESLKEQKRLYKNKKNTLIKIHDVKVNYPMKAKILTMLIKDVTSYNVQMASLSYIENEKNKLFYLDLVSSKNVQITELLEYLTKTYEEEFTFTIENISYESDFKKYFTKLKVQLKAKK